MSAASATLPPSSVQPRTPRGRWAGRPERTDVTSLLELTGPVARIILIGFLAVHALLAFAIPDERAQPMLTLFVFLPVATAGVLVTLSARDPYPLSWTVTVVGLCVVTNVLAMLQISPGERPLYATWHTSAVTIVLTVLTLRGRARWAWAGYLSMVIAASVWAVVVGAGADAVVAICVRHAAELTVVTLLAYGLRRMSRALERASATQRERLAAEAVSQAVDREAVEQVERLDRLAGRLLARVAAGVELTEAERRECLLVEASLRDQMRGRRLVVPDVAAAVRAARERGVTVTLIDDAGAAGMPEASAPVLAMADVIRAELPGLTQGSLVARLLPIGREIAGSVVVQPADADGHVVSIAADGSQI